jgi:hypothetical protein
MAISCGSTTWPNGKPLLAACEPHIRSSSGRLPVDRPSEDEKILGNFPSDQSESDGRVSSPRPEAILSEIQTLESERHVRRIRLSCYTIFDLLFAN